MMVEAFVVFSEGGWRACVEHSTCKCHAPMGEVKFMTGKSGRVGLCLATVFVVMGCGHPSYSQGVLWNHHVYERNQTDLERVGNQLGIVRKHVDNPLPLYDSDTVSNEFPVGTKIYSVPGKDPSEVIACQTPGGDYVQIEADPTVP